MQLAGARYSYEMQPAELDTHSSCSYAAHDEGRPASPLDVPPSLRLGPRVEHVKVVQDGCITEQLSEALSLSPVGPSTQSCTSDKRLVVTTNKQLNANW